MAADEEEIHGFHAVDEALRAGEPLRRIRIPQHRQRDAGLAPLLALAAERRIPVIVEPSRGNDRAGRNSPHSDIRASLPPFAYTPFREVRQRTRDAATTLIVAVDHLEDPQNLGAVLRNAEGAGADAVVMPERRNAAVTAATRRASAGASSYLRIARVPNIVAALQALKDDGCWVVGLSPAPQAQAYDDIDYANKCVVVVGAEGKGLSRLVSERCDILARIPLRGRIASLNAASAAAVALFEVSRRHSKS